MQTVTRTRGSLGVVGSGEMAQEIRIFDWESTALGAMTGWSEGLLSSVNTMLATRVPTAILWGSTFQLLYNDAYLDFLDVKHPSALGAPAEEVWSEMWAKVGSQLERVYLHGESIYEKDELIPLMRGGSLRDSYWSYSLSPLYVAEGVVGVITSGHDVTDSVRARMSLAQSQEKLQIALSATGCIGMWDWHVQEDLVFANEQFARAYGADPDEAAGQGTPIAAYLKKIHPDDVGHVQEGVVRSINSGSAFLDEYRLLQEDGSYLWVEARGRCIRGEDGLPMRFPGVTIDISRRKLMEGTLATSLMQALPQDVPVSTETTLLITLNALDHLLKSSDPGGQAAVVAASNDEDYLRLRDEVIARTLSRSGMSSAAGGMAFQQGGQARFGVLPEFAAGQEPMSADAIGSVQQKHLLYAITLLLNDWVRSILLEEQRAERETRSVH